MPGSTPQTWWALLAPRGTPAAVVTRLNTEIAQKLKQPDVLERYATLGIAPSPSTPEQVFEMVERESPAMGKILKDAGVEPE